MSDARTAGAPKRRAVTSTIPHSVGESGAGTITRAVSWTADGRRSLLANEAGQTGSAKQRSSPLAAVVYTQMVNDGALTNL